MRITCTVDFGFGPQLLAREKSLPEKGYQFEGIFEMMVELNKKKEN